MKDGRASDQVDWEDAKTRLTAGTEDVFDAAWYLTRSRIWPVVQQSNRGPIVLGIILALLVMLTVVLSPSTESHFIYTDF